MEALRFDFNGTSGEFKRTPQGFLRVKARLTRAGIFNYNQKREYRPEEEIFRADSLASLKGAPVTDLHPSETGGEYLLNPHNAKNHIVGIAESIEPDGKYLCGSLIVFHEDTIKAIESGARKEISLGFRCEVLPTPGVINGETYDAIQKNIIFNHIALGPKGWGRVGPDCAIKTDSKKDLSMKKTRLDGDEADALLSECQSVAQNLLEKLDALKSTLKEKPPAEAKEDSKVRLDEGENVTELLEACKQKIDALEEQLAALNKALEEEQKKRAELEDPKNIEEKVESKLRQDALKVLYPEVDLKNKNKEFIDGLYEGASRQGLLHRNDSLLSARKALTNLANSPKTGFEKWREASGKLWKQPLAGHVKD